MRYLRFTFILPEGALVSIGNGYEKKTEINYSNNLDMKINDNKYDFQLLQYKNDTDFPDYIAKLTDLGIKILDGEVWDNEDNRYYDRNEPVLEIQTNGTYKKTYPNKTQKSNYDELLLEDLQNKKNQKIGIIRTLTRDKIFEKYLEHDQRNILSKALNLDANIHYNDGDIVNMTTYIDNIRKQGRQLRDSVYECKTIEELDAVNIEIIVGE